MRNVLQIYRSPSRRLCVSHSYILNSPRHLLSLVDTSQCIIDMRFSIGERYYQPGIHHCHLHNLPICSRLNCSFRAAIYRMALTKSPFAAARLQNVRSR